MHYPKVGTANPIVTLYSLTLPAGPGEPPVINELLAPEAVRDEEHIISAVGWQNNQTFASCWMNRIQNRAYIQSCTGSVCQQFKTLTSTIGWVELFQSVPLNQDGTQMLIIASQEQRLNGGYRHLTLVSSSTGAETPLTSGRFVVQNILKWDETTNRIFYTANTEQSSESQHIYVVKAVAGQLSQCLTCNIAYDGVNQTYFSAEFSKIGNNLMLITDGPSIPRVDIYSWSVESATDGIRNFAFHNYLAN